MLAGILRLALLLSLWLGLGSAWAQGLQAIPPLSARVTDTTGTLQADVRARLEAKLQAFEQAQGTQILVLMVPTTAPEDIVDYTQRVGDAWKLGRKEVGDGLLLVVAKGDRTLRIAPAKALEGAVPDLAARRIIEEAITPRFRQGDFAGGIEAGLEQLMRLIRGEGLPVPQRAQASSDRPDWTSLLVFLFVAVPIAARVLSAMLGRKLGALLTGGAIGALAFVLGAGVLLAALAALIGSVFALASSLAPRRGVSWGGAPGWGGGRGSGSWGGGGGFRSGGGGDFGGGGASGRW
jgi:uncharacterized protein